MCLFQESGGFGPRDNKRCNPGSDGANECHSCKYAQLLMWGKDLEAKVVAGTEKGAEAGEEANEKWNHGLGFIA
jgi:hypothetical protein